MHVGSLEQTSAPAVEPITKAQLKTNKRIEFDDEDSFIDDLITQARRQVEDITKRQCITATWAYRLDYFPNIIYVPRPPLQSVTSIQYVDTAGDTQTLAASKYRVDTNSLPGRIDEAWGEVWPSTREVVAAVTVTFDAGYGDAATDVPWAIRRAILLLASHYWEYRDGEVDIPDAVLSLLEPYMEPSYA